MQEAKSSTGLPEAKKRKLSNKILLCMKGVGSLWVGDTGVRKMLQRTIKRTKFCYTVQKKQQFVNDTRARKCPPVSNSPHLYNTLWQHTCVSIACEFYLHAFLLLMFPLTSCSVNYFILFNIILITVFFSYLFYTIF